MATQAYRSRFDNTVGSNEGTAKVAPGHAPELQPKPGAENKTPAPLRTVSGEASSLNPGERTGPATINPMARVDAVLDNVLRGAETGGDDWQTRPVDSSRDCPVAFGMKPRAASGTVPASTGTSVSAPVRKP